MSRPIESKIAAWIMIPIFMLAFCGLGMQGCITGGPSPHPQESR